MWFAKRFESTNITGGFCIPFPKGSFKSHSAKCNLCKLRNSNYFDLAILQIVSCEYLPESQPFVRVFLRNIV